MVLTSKLPNVQIPEVSVYQYFSNTLKRYGDRVALVDAATEKQLTFNDVRSSSFKLASALTRKGLKKQEVVALCTSNCIEYPVVILGVAACNAITTTCNPLYTIDEITKQFENSQPKYVFTDSTQASKLKEVARKIPSIQEVFTIEDNSSCTSIWSLISQDDGKSFPFDASVDVHEDVVLLPYSSGTTGVPKGVMHTHYSIVSLCEILRGLNMSGPNATAYTVVPMFHAYGLARLFSSLDGIRHIIDKRFNVERYLQAVQKYKITSFYGVPEMVMKLINSPLLEKYDTSSLMVMGSAAAPMATNLKVIAMEKMKLPMAQGYGLTESIVSAITFGAICPLDSVGYLIANTKLKVVDPQTRRELGPNEDGELLLKGPQVMKGYYKNREATAASFDEGWYCTGDIGHYDEYGRIYIVDRMKELIKYKGFQVAPAELENVIFGHPKVKDVGITGIKDTEAGEVPKAFVVRKDETLTALELHRFVEEKVSKYKYLRGGIQFVDEIPRNATGKILRRKLKELQSKNLSKL